MLLVRHLDCTMRSLPLVEKMKIIVSKFAIPHLSLLPSLSYRCFTFDSPCARRSKVLISFNCPLAASPSLFVSSSSEEKWSDALCESPLREDLEKAKVGAASFISIRIDKLHTLCWPLCTFNVSDLEIISTLSAWLISKGSTLEFVGFFLMMRPSFLNRNHGIVS